MKNLIEKETLREIKINFSNNERRREEKKREGKRKTEKGQKTQKSPLKKETL